MLHWIEHSWRQRPTNNQYSLHKPVIELHAKVLVLQILIYILHFVSNLSKQVSADTVRDPRVQLVTTD